MFALANNLFAVLDTIGSDSVYLFCSAGALLIVTWVDQSGYRHRHPAWSAAAVGAALLLCIATRSVGFALVAAVGLREISETWRRRRLLSHTLWLGAFLGSGLLTYQLLLSGSNQYGAQFTLNFPLIAQGAVFYLRAAAPLWSAAPALLRYPLAGGVVALVAVALLTRAWGVIEWYVVIFYGMLCFYTYSNDFRYMLPVLPLCLFLAAERLRFFSNKFLAARSRISIGAIAALALLATSFNTDWDGSHHRGYCETNVRLSRSFP